MMTILVNFILIFHFWDGDLALWYVKRSSSWNFAFKLGRLIVLHSRLCFTCKILLSAHLKDFFSFSCPSQVAMTSVTPLRL